MRSFRPVPAAATFLAVLVLLPALAVTPSPTVTPPDPPVAPEPGATADVELRESRGARVSVFTGDIVIPADLRHRGTVLCIGCDVEVAGEVADDVVVVGGALTMTGSGGRSVVGIFADMDLDGATIRDDLVNVLGSVARSDVRVGGQVVDIGVGDWLPGFPSTMGVLAGLIFWTGMVKLIGAFVLVVLVAVVVPERVRLIADEAPARYGTAWFVGLLAYVLFGLVVLPLALATLVGFPVAILAFKAMKWLGVAGLFLAVGDRLGRSMGRPLSLLAAILIVFTPLALLRLAPVWFGVPGILLALTVSSLTWLFFHVPAVGIALLTRFGTRRRAAAPVPPT